VLPRRIALAVGAAIAAYLTVLHYTGTASLYCPGSGTGLINCEDVLTSPESVWLGLPVPLWGFMWFLLGFGIRWHTPASRGWRAVTWLWGAVGVAAVLALVYVELGILHALCVWCSALHLLILFLFADWVWTATSPSEADADG
jgi:uncharacterized membrane protein